MKYIETKIKRIQMRKRSKTQSIHKKSTNPFQNNPINIEIVRKKENSVMIDIDSYLNMDYQSSTNSSSELITTNEDIQPTHKSSLKNQKDFNHLTISDQSIHFIQKEQQEESDQKDCLPPPSTPRDSTVCFQKATISEGIELLSDILIQNYDSESISVLEHLHVLSKRKFFFKGSSLSYYKQWHDATIV